MVGKKQENIDEMRLEKRLRQEPEIFDKSRESQLRMIEATFKSVPVKDIKHPDKPHLTAVEVFPLLPNFDRWPDMFMHCLFDDDPAVKPLGKLRSQLSKEEAEQRLQIDQELSRSILKPMIDPSRDNEQFMVYFSSVTPQEEEMEDTTQRMDAIRHYNFHLHKEQPMEKLFIEFTQDGKALYNPIQGRIQLRKRRTHVRRFSFIDTYLL